jgi:hypothetical protein
MTADEVRKAVALALREWAPHAEILRVAEAMPWHWYVTLAALEGSVNRDQIEAELGARGVSATVFMEGGP